MPDEADKTILKAPVSGSSDGEKYAMSSYAEATDSEQHRESIEDRARNMATKAGQKQHGWQANYTALIRQVSSFYCEEINGIIHPINNSMSKFLNGLYFDLNHGPDKILTDMESDFGSLLAKAKKYRSSYREFMEKLKQERKIFPNLTEDDVRKTSIKTSGSWVLFIAILAVMILIESTANMSLLAGALEGGLIQAFVVAVLVSIINVAGVGAGAGFLCAFLYRKMRELFYFVFSMWFVVVVFLNLIVGRHRENFVLDIEAKEKIAEAGAVDLSGGLSSLVVSAADIAAVSFNPITWKFESVLFFLLGIGLSAFGFYKGLSFFAPGENIKPFLEKLDTLKQEINQGIEAIPKQCNDKLSTLRQDVGQEITDLNHVVNKGENAFQSMEHGWDIIINVIETEFVNSYNFADPTQKIAEEDIRGAKVAAVFPATSAVRETITRGKNAIQDYDKHGKEKFFNTIASITSKILNMQCEYRDAIQGVMDDNSRP